MSPTKWLFVVFLILIGKTNSYLPPTQISALNDTYISLNGDKWTQCHWNLTFLATTKFLPVKHCGLLIRPTRKLTQQTVFAINFKYDNNLNGTLPNSINKLSDIEAIQIWSNELVTGDIPNTICDLDGLGVFSFTETNIQRIPDCIGSLPSMTALEFRLSPQLTINPHLIELLCNNTNIASLFTVLHFENINYLGSIPYCIGEKLPALGYFYMLGLPDLIGSIPTSFNNLTQLTDFELIDLPNLTGHFPSKILPNNQNLRYFAIANTNLSGTLHIEELCNQQDLYDLQISRNPHLLPFQIPECIGKLSNLQLCTFWLQPSYSHLLYGTIPNSICNATNLLYLLIRNTALTGTIPQCIGQLKQITWIQLQNNNFFGTMPSIFSSKIKVLQIASNSFSGSISDIFSLDKYPELELAVLHENNFFDDNIGTFITTIFSGSPHLKGLTLYKNDFIGGSFPTFSNNIYLNSFHLLALQELDISGVLPNNLYFGVTNTSSLTLSLYNNRFSSDIPKQLIIADPTNVNSTVLVGNSFTIKQDEDIPNWMSKSLFIDAKQLYLTSLDFFKSDCLLVVGVMLFFCAVIIKINCIQIKIFGYLRNERVEEPFIQNIQKLTDILNDWKVLVITLILCVYYVTSMYFKLSTPYYSSFPLLSYVCIFFLGDDNVWTQIILYSLIIIYNILIINLITNTMNTMKTTLNQSTLDPNQLKIYDWDSFEKSKIGCIFYVFFYITFNAILFFYWINDSLPTNNIFGFTEFEQSLISGSTSFVLAILSIIIPSVASSITHSICICTTCMSQNRLLVILRNLNTIFIPLLCSFLLSNNCGNSWTRFWNPCHQQLDSFDITEYVSVSDIVIEHKVHNVTTAFIYFSFPPVQVNVLTHEQVCQPFENIKWNKCFRTFLFKWCHILLMKAMIGIIIPFISTICTWLFNKIKQRKREYSYVYIMMDNAYQRMTGELYMMLAFGVFCPLLYPVIIISMNSYIFVYKLQLKCCKWKVQYNHYEMFKFPFFVGIAIQQIFALIFLISFDNSKWWMLLLFGTTLVAVDICYGCRQYKFRSYQKPMLLNVNQ